MSIVHFPAKNFKQPVFSGYNLSQQHSSGSFWTTSTVACTVQTQWHRNEQRVPTELDFICKHIGCVSSTEFMFLRLGVNIFTSNVVSNRPTA
jgi:hypothetical protein